MFKIFNKNNNNEVVVKEPVYNKKKTVNEIIDEIHESFYTEVDKLLANAKILKSTDTQLEDLIKKAEQLKSLGFINTKECKEAQVEINRLNILKEENNSKNNLVDAINYFTNKYPLYKFITEESVKKICNKYNLVYGTVDNYLGTVPDKNQKDIANNHIKIEDHCYEEISEAVYQGLSKYIKPIRNISRHTFEQYFIEYSKNKIQNINNITQFFYYKTYNSKEYKKCLLEIAAPIKDFNMENMNLEGTKLVQKIEIPDPVVLQPVIFKNTKHYLILTAWGQEASDELVVNNKFN